MIDETKTAPEGQFDHGILFHSKVRLVCFRPHGPLDEEAMTSLVKLTEDKEKRGLGAVRSLHRYLAAGRDPPRPAFVYRIALHRRATFADRPPVKSAFYVTNSAAARVVELHARVTENSPLQVRLFEDLDSAARWLGVTRSMLD